MQRDTDLTHGSITRKLLMVAVPIMGTSLLQMAYNLTDMFWLGRSADAANAVASSGIGGMFIWLSMALMMFGRMGAEIGVSQNLGRGDEASAEQYGRAAIRMAALLGVLYAAILMIFTAQLVTPFVPGDEHAQVVRTGAETYLWIVALGVPMTYITAAVTGVFNGAGNSRLSFICNATGLVINVILDPIMINTLGWGIAGAAIATVIAQGVVCLLFVIFIRTHKQRPLKQFRFRGKEQSQVSGQIFKWAWPVVLESAVFTLLAMVVSSMVAGYGSRALTVQRIGSQIESLSWLIGGGFGTAITAFVGQNFGARQYDRIRAGLKIALTWLTCWQTLVTLVMFFMGGALYKIFIDDPQIWEMGIIYLRILSFCVILGGVEGACSGAFRGMGKTMPPSFCSIASNLLRPVLCYLMSIKMGLYGLWWGVTLTAALRGLLIGIWYYFYSKKHLPRIGEGV